MYEEYFEFTERPFKLSPDPRFFFLSPHHKKAMSYLEYGISLGEGFIVITGPVGSGKTTLARNLISTLGPEIVATQIVTSKLKPLELLSLVATKFGLTPNSQDKAEVISSIEAYLRTLHSAGKRALLVVDEAQNLPAETVEELRMLSNLQLDDKPLIQSFLLGQEELKGIIELPQMEQFRQRIIASCHLKPFNQSQTEQYILHRLSQVGWKQAPQLDPEIFPLICSQTHGIPRKINLLMDRLFLSAYLEELSVITVSDLQEVLDEMHQEFSNDVFDSTKHQPTLNYDGVAENQRVNSLTEVTRILDEVISRKVETVKQLEKIIDLHHQKLTEKDESGSLKQADIHSISVDVEKTDKIEDSDERLGTGLGEKYWFKKLSRS